jgi:hypothetical protein
LGFIDGGVRDGRAALAGLGPSVAAHQAAFVAFAHQWDGIYPDMSGMLGLIKANVGNYDAVAALPAFTLFPWFFVIPGVLVLVLLGVGLAGLGRRWPGVRIALIALGVGLVLAPLVFGMFSRAPKGATMVGAFRTIETRPRVERIQGYFGEIATGQGAVALQLVPALAHAGLSDAQVAARYPGIRAFDAQWIHVLNDLTPMIGAMSDNVTNYQAVAALPSFDLFPWFFVVPGLLLVALAFASGAPGTAGAPGCDANSSNQRLEGVT